MGFITGSMGAFKKLSKKTCIYIVSIQNELQTASTILLGQTQKTEVKSSFYFHICGVRVNPP